MTLNLNVAQTDQQLTPRITVIGIGGAGGNAVNNMIQSNLEGVEFLVANTDAQALSQSLCERRLQLGRHITQGLGAGSRPDIGRAAAEEAMDEILAQLEGTNMVFITAGLGGGTGTGAAPVIARAAREADILTVGVITKPFHFEGVHRMRIAENGLSDLQEYVDTLIIIPNQNLFRVANEKTTFADAFKMADDVLYSGVRGVTDLMVMPGLINLDFADIRAVMSEMGKAMMGTGEAEGDNRAVAAAEAAISNPLLDDITMKGARGVLINITGSEDLTLFEADEAANRIRDEVDPEANIIFGSTFDPSLEGRMRVSVVATGIDVEAASQPRPVTLSLVSDRAKADRAAQPAVAAAPEQAEASETVAEAPAPAPAAVQPRAASSAPSYAAAAMTAVPIVTSALAVATEITAEAAPQQTVAREAAFVPPPPVQPAARGAATPQPVRRPDPFAAAALANATRNRDAEEAGEPRGKARGLFARMTSAARKAAMEQDEAPAAPVAQAERPQPAAAPRPAETQEAARPAARPAAPAQARTEPQAAARPAAQPRLAGLEPGERVASATSEDDLLDIPAFLRRQAN